MGSCTELVAPKASKTDIRCYSADGGQISVILRILDIFCDVAKEGASLCDMTLSAFVRTCMIEELAKKGGIEA